MAEKSKTVFLNVFNDVASKLREESSKGGFDESKLAELQQLWGSKLVQSGVVDGPIERNSPPSGSGVPTVVHDLKVPYEATEQYETPPELLFPPIPKETPIQTPLPGESSGYQHTPGGNTEYGASVDSRPAADIKPRKPAYMIPMKAPTHTPLPREPSGYQYTPGGNTEYGASVDSRPAADIKRRKSAPYMEPPSPWMTQRPLGVDLNAPYEEPREEDEGGGMSQTKPPMKDFFIIPSGKQKREEYPPNIPQRDGSEDVSLDSFSKEMVPKLKNSANEIHSETLRDRLEIQERKKANAAITSIIEMKQASATIPQLDGHDDIYNDGVRKEDYNTPSYYGTPKPIKTEALEDDEPPPNEDDDDELDDLDQGDEELSDLVLARFEKATGEFDF